MDRVRTVSAIVAAEVAADVLPAGADEPGLSAVAPRDYQLLRPLGEGGAGRVYLAERQDGGIRQQVALKLLGLPAAANRRAVPDFLNESRLLARLNHPNIAQLLDAGLLDDRRPFLALEYVEGTAIDRHCREAGLSWQARVALFLKVCAAVRHAHRHLVIHRDLKPSNILVTADGEPKLLDFGIARAAPDPRALPTATAAGSRFLTLAYASPEQLAGQPLTVATDVYSLGVVLYELLCGSRPWADQDDPVAQLRQLGQEAPPPGMVLRRQAAGGPAGPLPADLDAVVLKALRREPPQRYESVQALADDLQRVLEERPVRARNGQFGYRLRKTLYRHRHAAAAAAAVLAFSLLFLADRQTQLELTRRETASVREVQDFFLSLFSDAGDLQQVGTAVSATELVERGAARLLQALPQDPTTQAEMLRAVAMTKFELGDSPGAAALMAHATAAARRLPESQGLLIARVLNDAAYLLRATGDPAAALPLAQEVVDRYQTGHHANLSLAYESLSTIGEAKRRLGLPYDEVMPYLDRAIAILPFDSAHLEDLLDARKHLARALAAYGRHQEAVAVATMNAETAIANFGENHPISLTYRAEQAGSLIGQRPGESVARLQAILAYQRRHFADEYRAASRVPADYLGRALAANGDWANAEPLLRARFEAAGRTLRPASDGYLSALQDLAEALIPLGRAAEAAALYQQAMPMIDATYLPAARTAKRARLQAGLALALAAEGRHMAAAALLDAALAGLPETFEYQRDRTLASALRSRLAAPPATSPPADSMAVSAARH